MALFNCLARRFVGLSIPKPGFKRYQSTIDESNSPGPSQLSDDCNDAPVDDMENPFQKERRQCLLCKMNITPNYKNSKLLSQFVSMYTGKVYGRHITGLCRKRQEQVEAEIFKSQNAGIMPYYMKDPAFMQDPQLFNPDTPFRKHPY